MIIAIDGPAGSGKSTTAREVARRLGFLHLDSGAFYRALTWAALRAEVPEEEWQRLDVEALDGFGITAVRAGDGLRLAAAGDDVGDAVRAPEVSARVSRMARVPAVRAWVDERLRELGRAGDVVADGRDLGTVVFPDAELKVFLVAEPRTRARRRLRDHGVDAPTEAEIDAETARLAERDRMDSQREVAPLRRAADAVDLDTSELTFDEQVERIIALAEERGATR